MKFSLLLLFLTIFAGFTFINAQDTNQSEKICFQPFSWETDEFDFQDSAELQERLALFEKKLGEYTDEAKGYIIFYGGNKMRINAVNEAIAETKRILKMPEQFSVKYKYQVLNGGFRYKPAVEFFIKPLECSQTPDATPNLSADEVEFAETPKEKTIRKQSFEIEENAIEKAKAKCAAAARAVGACDEKSSVEIHVIIDEDGKVIFARAVSGHPLNRSAGVAAAYKWKFKPTIINKIKFNVVGTITLYFEKPENAVLCD